MDDRIFFAYLVTGQVVFRRVEFTRPARTHESCQVEFEFHPPSCVRLTHGTANTNLNVHMAACNSTSADGSAWRESAAVSCHVGSPGGHYADMPQVAIIPSSRVWKRAISFRIDRAGDRDYVMTYGVHRRRLLSPSRASYEHVFEYSHVGNACDRQDIDKPLLQGYMVRAGALACEYTSST
jgi:hypothetical protein